MMKMNLFSYFSHGEEEPYFTKAFAYLLQKLAELDRPAFDQLLRNLSRLSFTGEMDVRIRSEETISTGLRPDIIIETPGKLVYFEHKIRSRSYLDQLRRYRNELDGITRCSSFLHLTVYRCYDKLKCGCSLY